VRVEKTKHSFVHSSSVGVAEDRRRIDRRGMVPPVVSRRRDRVGDGTRRRRNATTTLRKLQMVMTPLLFAVFAPCVVGAVADDAGRTQAYPRVLQGAFKGSWWLDAASVEGADRLTEGGWARGECSLRLRTSFDDDSRVQSVIGEVTLREGAYISKDDAHVTMEGVYTEATGGLYLTGESKLRKRFESATNKTLDTSSSWAAESSYRQSLRAIALDLVDRTGVDSGGDQNRFRARDSYSRDDAVKRAGKSARAKFIGDHDAGEYPVGCQFKMHAYVGPGNHSSDEIPRIPTVEDGPHGDILERQLEDMSPLEFADMPKLVTLVGKLVSENCGITVHFDLTSQPLETWYTKTRLYAYMMMCAALAQAYVLVKQIEHSSTQSTLMRVSLLSVGTRAVIDSYYCLSHLTAGILVDDLFMPLSAVALCYFVLFSVLEMRILVAAWRARRPQIQGWLELRVDLSAVYSRFYAGFIAGMFMMYWLADNFIIFILLMNSYWIPQIIRTAYHNHRHVYKPWYVVTTSYARLIGPMYVLACPTNFMRIKPNYFEACLLILWTTAQTAMMLAQHYINPRYGLPDGIFPEIYDYHRKVPDEVLTQCGFTDQSEAPPEERDIEMGDLSSGPDCVICMNSVDVHAVNERMVTPCNHFFHTKCLTKWIDIKQECPTCRRHLPPM
jgi:hypothetical protein